MPATSPRITLVFRDPTLAERIIERAVRGLRPAVLSRGAGEELKVFDRLLGQELRRSRLTLAEARTLAEIVGEDRFDPYETGLLLYAETSYAFRLANQRDPTGAATYAVRFGIDEQALLDKLLIFGPTADLALRDALSRWWDRTTEGHDDPSNDPTEADRRDGAAFRAVGIALIRPSASR